MSKTESYKLESCAMAAIIDGGDDEQDCKLQVRIMYNGSYYRRGRL